MNEEIAKKEDSQESIESFREDMMRWREENLEAKKRDEKHDSHAVDPEFKPNEITEEEWEFWKKIGDIKTTDDFEVVSREFENYRSKQYSKQSIVVAILGNELEKKHAELLFPDKQEGSESK